MSDVSDWDQMRRVWGEAVDRRQTWVDGTDGRDSRPDWKVDMMNNSLERSLR